MHLATPLLAATLAGGCALASAAGQARWLPVPGAENLDIAASGLTQEGLRATATLRWQGRPGAGIVPAVHGMAAGAHRTTARVEFDCGRHTVRVLGTTAYDARGTALSMSATPGPQVKVGAGDFAWAYDAVCEALREQRQ